MTDQSPIIRTDQVTRLDAFRADTLFELGGLLQNPYTGMGMRGADQSIGTTIGVPILLSEFDLRSLYRHNWLIKRVINLPARDMVRAGFNLKITDGNTFDASAIYKACQRLKFGDRVRQALQWARLFGQAYIVIRANKDEALDKPLTVDRVKSIDSLWVYDRYQLRPAAGEWNWNDPEFYQLVTSPAGSHLLGKNGEALKFNQKIHKSRVLVFSGEELPPTDRRDNSGCDDSVIQSMFSAFQKYTTASASINEAINSFSILTVSINNLSELVAAGKLDAAKDLVKEIALSKSLFGVMINDASLSKSDFMGRQLGGVDSIFSSVIVQELTAASTLPHYKLWGEVGKASLADSGGAESKAYADLVSGWQDADLRDPYEYFLPMLMQAELGEVPDDWGLEFNSLYSIPPKEKAEIFYIESQAYEKLAGIPRVVRSEEIRQALGSDQDLANAIDLDDELDDFEEEEPEEADEEDEEEEPIDGEEEGDSIDEDVEEVVDRVDDGVRFDAVKLSSLKRNSNGQVYYQGSWWTVNKPKTAPKGSKHKKQVLASKKINGETQVKLVSFGHRDYKHNYSAKARQNYLKRSAGIKGKNGKPTASDRHSANYWARKKLWDA